MKINKIVAAGAAATLAVTSLASVASAKNPRSWSLVYNYAVIQANPVVTDRGGNALSSIDTNTNIFGTGPIQKSMVNTKGGITEAYDLLSYKGAAVEHGRGVVGMKGADATYDGDAGKAARADTNGDGQLTDADFDALIPVYVTCNTSAVVDSDNNTLKAYAGGISVVVKGRKRDNANFVAIEKKTSLQTNIKKINANGSLRNQDVNCKGDALSTVAVGTAMFTDDKALGVDMGANAWLCYLPLYVTTAPEGALMPTDFDAVDNIKVDVSGMKSIAWATDSKNEYFLESDLIATYWNYDWLDYYTNATEKKDYLVPKDLLTTWYDQEYTNAGAVKTGFADKGATGRCEVKFRVPTMYSKYKGVADDTVAADAARRTYKSAVQLTGKSTKVGGDGADKNELIMDGEVIPFSYDADNLQNGGIAVVPANGLANIGEKGGATAGDPDKYYDAQGNIMKLDPSITGRVGNNLIEKIADLVDGVSVKWRIEVAELAESNAWLPMTDIYPTDGTLYRNEIWVLSDTEDYRSISQWGVQDSTSRDFNQTYTVEDYRRGTRPLGFAGLASQVADYFNKELNGTITFTFADVSNLNGRTWLTGGIPSTEVGLRNVLSGANPDDFALYFNYASTTGSLETVVDIDVDAGEVTFDISNLLDQLGGYTIGTIHDIYYGMTKYTSLWNNVPGMWVSQVTLRAEDGADVSPAVEDDDVTTVDDDDDVAIEDDDDDIAIEDDDDIAIEDDDDIAIEDDDDIAIDDDDDAGEVEVISGDDDDANPHTGVALAVVPAIVAAAAIVVSKKRK